MTCLRMCEMQEKAKKYAHTMSEEKHAFAKKFYYDNPRLSRMIDLYYSGNSLTELAKSQNVSYQTAKNWITKPFVSPLWLTEYGQEILDFAISNGYRKQLATHAANEIFRLKLNPAEITGDDLLGCRGLGDATIDFICDCFHLQGKSVPKYRG